MQNRGGIGPGETRNMIIAVVLSLAILLGFQFFYAGPQQARLAEQQRAQAEEQLRQQNAAQTEGAGGTEAPAVSGPVSREQALNGGASRIAIDTPEVDGSISLVGARIDDLSLRQYRQTTDRDSAEVTLLSPINTQYGHDAFFGWEVQSGENSATLSDSRSPWTAPEGARLAPGQPVTLTFNAGDGRTIERTIAIDDHFMFTITDVVRNASGAPISVRPFGTVRRDGLPEGYRDQAMVHQGLIGAFGPTNSLQQTRFKQAQDHAKKRVRGRVGEDQRIEEAQGTGGWFGITEHYWLAAIIPDQNERVSAYFDSRQEDGAYDYRAAYRGQWRDVPAGGEITYTQRFFAGAKRVDLLQAYQRDLQIPKFDDAVDWGNMSWPLTRPFFTWILHPLSKLAGSFALGLLLSTVVIKLAMFPLVYQSYKAMAKMRVLGPKMKEIQERYAADKQRQQQEILKLYQVEKINPVAGCLPMLATIPVFFALYKTLSVTIEMRHAPFFGTWIRDLAAPDPTSIFNLFGLLPALGFDFHSIPVLGALIPAVGVWALLYGVSMWALQALSPPPTDPVQAQIFRFLPIIFTLMFASFPAGLVIYWVWSNMLTIMQQYVIMRRQGTETQLDKFLAKRFAKSAKPAE